MDDITTRFDSKFRFVLLAAQRAEQLMRGARPRLENAQARVTRTAMEEVRKDLIEWDYGPAPEPEPVEEAPAGEEVEAPADEGGVN